MYVILNKEHFTFHLQYKHSGKFANRSSGKYEELSYPKNRQKICDDNELQPINQVSHLSIVTGKQI